MDAGRQWALETFGMYGPRIREQIVELVNDEHSGSLDAQDASGHRSRSVYGEFWRGILERFEVFAELPGASLVRPGLAPYKIPVVNGVALFPWRYAKSQESDLAVTPFSTSDARMAVTNLLPPMVQDTLDIDLPDPGLSADESALLTAFQDATRDPAVTSGRLVLVAISSSVSGLFHLEWGVVEVTAAGCAEWMGFHESLLSSLTSAPVSVSPVGTFAGGDLPSKFPQVIEKSARSDER